MTQKEAMGSSPVQAWMFFFSELLFHCLSCEYGKGMLYVHVRNIPSKKKKKKKKNYNDR